MADRCTSSTPSRLLRHGGPAVADERRQRRPRGVHGRLSSPCSEPSWYPLMELGARIERVVGRLFEGEEAVLHVIERIVAPLGLRVDATSPWVDARLPDGSRVQTRFPCAPFRPGPPTPGSGRGASGQGRPSARTRLAPRGRDPSRPPGPSPSVRRGFQTARR
jgi:hypothetical protein